MWTGSALNEGYIHDHVDFVVDEIERRGMFLVVVLHESSPIELARALLARYANRRAVLFWVLRNGMDDYVSAITSIVGARALPATYIYEIDQSGDWRQLYTAVGGGDAARLFDLRPARPIVMADGMYDQDLPGPTCDGCSDDFGSAFHRTPFGIRRGAWVTFTHGGFFTYGHPPVWGYPSGWESELTFPSVAFLTRFQRFWTAIAWEKLTPDRALASEIAGDDFVKEHLGVLRSTAGDGVYAYFPGPGSARVALDSLTATNVVASWFNPATGDAPAAGNFKRTDKPVFSVPGGWEDALLVVKPAP
jgi:hypothetical protein